MFCFNISSKLLLVLFVLCVLKSVVSLSNLHWKYQEFLVETVRIMSGMSGIRGRNLDWQPRLRYPFRAENLVLNYSQCSEKVLPQVF